MALFEKPDSSPIIPVETAQAYAEDAAKAASAVKLLMGSEGWALFLAYIEVQRVEIYAKSDYESLEAFRTDRRALELVDEAIYALSLQLEDAEQAAALLTKLIGAESQTPTSHYNISTGGSVEG